MGSRRRAAVLPGRLKQDLLQIVAAQDDDHKLEFRVLFAESSADRLALRGAFGDEDGVRQSLPNGPERGDFLAILRVQVLYPGDGFACCYFAGTGVDGVFPDPIALCCSHSVDGRSRGAIEPDVPGFGAWVLPLRRDQRLVQRYLRLAKLRK